VYEARLTEMFANALKELGCRRAFVVHGHDGLDEISVCDNTRVSELVAGAVKTYDIYPDMYFGELAEPQSLEGGEPSVNAEIITDVFAGKKGHKRNVVAINAAAAIVAAGKADYLEQGLAIANDILDEALAAKKLADLVEFVK
jgi:anthranilate phosphoribosyltransferase